MFDLLEGANFRYDSSFFKRWLKNTHIKYFWSLIYKLLILRQDLPLDKFVVAHFKHDSSIFKLHPKNTKAFLVLDLRIFIFHKILFLEKFKGFDFKYGNTFFKSQFKNTQIRHFWS